MQLIPAELFNNLYLIIVLFLSLIVFLQYRDRKDNNNYKSLKSKGVTGWFLAVFFILFIGTRPISEVFSDMTQYYGIYTIWDGPFKFEWSVNSKLYNNLMNLLASIGFQPLWFYILIAAIYFGCMYIACRKLFPYNQVAAFILCLGAFSTFAAGTNGIKAGAAASLFLLALAYRDKILISLIFIILSIGFHHSMILPAVAFLFALIYHNPRLYIAFWFLCLIMALLHITTFQVLFSSITDEQGAEYLLNIGKEWGGKSTGFRIDFVLYSALPIIMGWYAVFKRKVKDKHYLFALCTYILTNAIWLLCMYASFTNRIAYLSWLMYPIVLVYPCFLAEFGRDRYKFFSWILAFHLAFTFIMNFNF